MNAVEVSGLNHRYGDRVALDGIDFRVAAGALFAVVGPNGGGKSTTFRILSTLIRPASGSVSILGEDAVKHPERVRARIGVVFQSPALDKKLSVKENLHHQAYLYGIRGKSLELRCSDLLARLGLMDRATDRVETLSGGLMRRVEIAKGLLHSPSLLLLDEPTTGLDPLARRELWDYLTLLRKRDGLTILTTTHLLDEAEACSEVVLLDRGKIVAHGTPDALKETLGGDVISLRSRDPQRLKAEIEEKFRMAAKVVDGQVRLERQAGHEFIPALVSAFAEQIEAVTVAKPTLEDLFILKTGHGYGSTEGARA